VGMLMGVHLPGVEAVLGGQEAILDDIEESLADLQRRVSHLQNQVSLLEEFQQARTETLIRALPYAVEGRLSGCRVGLIFNDTHWDEDASALSPDQQLHRLLRVAGAEVAIHQLPGFKVASVDDTVENTQLWVLIAPPDESEQAVEIGDELAKPLLVAIWNTRFSADEDDGLVVHGVRDPAGQLELIALIAHLWEG